jgi:DNA-binding response OmpR family regulator
MNSPAALAELNGCPATVLVVEDEAVLRVAVAKMLRKQGFSVLEAADGTEALTLFRVYKDEIAVVLLDVTLPGAPAPDVLSEVRNVSPATSVIVTSAYGKNTVDAFFSGTTVDLFIRKPYQLADLVTLVRSRLSGEDQNREKLAWI